MSGLSIIVSFQGDCEGFTEVLDIYNAITPKIRLGGPSNFAPLIEESIKIVKEKKQVRHSMICSYKSPNYILTV